LKLPRVGAFKVDPLCNQVPFPHRVLRGEAKIRETLKLQLPQNDGGISYGQAAVAAARSQMRSAT